MNLKNKLFCRKTSHDFLGGGEENYKVTADSIRMTRTRFMRLWEGCTEVADRPKTTLDQELGLLLLNLTPTLF